MLIPAHPLIQTLHLRLMLADESLMHYLQKAEGHKLKMDLLNDVIYNDIASANQIIAGGRGTGVPRRVAGEAGDGLDAG